MRNISIGWRLAGLVLVVGGCSSSTNSDAGNPDAGNNDGGFDSGVQRGPASIAVDGDPNGLWWDAPTSTLYIADNINNRILTWTEDRGFASLANLPAPAGNPGTLLGQLIITASGTIVVTQFGFGTAGAVVTLDKDGTNVVTVPNLDVTKRRLGLTLADDGTLYDAYFVKTGSTFTGAVARLTLDGTETDVITGLQKATGVLALGGNLYVSDQAQQEILVAAVGTGLLTPTLLVSNIQPDLLASGPSGTFFSGSSATNGSSEGQLFQIGTTSGTFDALASGYTNPRGSAYDALNHRVFFADHHGDSGNLIVIYPTSP